MNEPRGPKADVSAHLDRIWRELKGLTRQVENETRRSSQIARLRYEIRGLRQQREEASQQLGAIVYAAQRESARRPMLARVAGHDDLIADLRELDVPIEAKQEAIEARRRDLGWSANAA